jgi:hypothetical protein
MKTCYPEEAVNQDVRFTEEEVVALFMNMIAFDGDWQAHLNFLDGLEPTTTWKYDQIPLVRELERRDRMHAIQEFMAEA